MEADQNNRGQVRVVFGKPKCFNNLPHPHNNTTQNTFLNVRDKYLNSDLPTNVKETFCPDLKGIKIHLNFNFGLNSHFILIRNDVNESKHSVNLKSKEKRSSRVTGDHFFFFLLFFPPSPCWELQSPPPPFWVRVFSLGIISAT